MTVTKRNLSVEPFAEGKIKTRIERASKDLEIDTDDFLQRVLRALPHEISSKNIDGELARLAFARSVDHPDYDILSARIFASALQKNVGCSFSEAVEKAFNHSYRGQRCSLVDETFYILVQKNKEVLNKAICPERDATLSYFGLRTLCRSYLLQSNDKKTFFETPQYLFLRVAVAINIKNDYLNLRSAIDTYNAMSKKMYTHATPTLFNAGTPKNQLSSCFLLTMKDDSISGIFDTIKQCAKISKYAGGIGLSTSTIRASGSYIRGTNGFSNGIVPMLRVLNNTSRYVDQGGGKRKGSIAVYLEMWHADILDFLSLKLVTGKEESRARDLFYACYISDEFMKRVKENKTWSLFCPDQAPGLCDVYGDDFVNLYTRYEKEKKYVSQIPAQDIWAAILTSQVETGVPYMVYKDACNKKSNQKNLGCIRSSNLCTEIVQFSSPKEIAVCNLASLSLPAFVGEDKCFDYNLFHTTVKLAVKNLNKVIDTGMYVLKKCEVSNFKHRPIGLGVQGLADALIKMDIVYDSEEGIKTDEKIFEVMYHAAMESSWEESVEHGPYSSFEGSPTSVGKFQFDLWNETENVYQNGFYKKDVWEDLKDKVKRDGIRNSLLIAPMPTATTSQIMGNFTESFSPLPSVLYQRRTLTGDFVLSHPHFIRELIALGKWDKSIQAKIQENNGCVENISEIPQFIRDKYKSVWSMSQKWVIDHAVARAKYICQSQSLNVFLKEVTTGKLTSLHFYAHSKGLKTGMYYLRSQSKSSTIKFGLNTKEDEVCESCSS